MTKKIRFVERKPAKFPRGGGGGNCGNLVSTFQKYISTMAQMIKCQFYRINTCEFNFKTFPVERITINILRDKLI